MGKFQKKPSSAKREDAEIEAAFRQVTGGDSKNSVPASDDSDDTTPVIKKNKKIMLISLCSVALVAVIAIGLTVGFLFGGIGDDGRILADVMVAGVNLGGMTRDEAIKAIHDATDLTYTQEDMVVQLPDTTLTLSPANTGAALNVEAAVDAALDYGRTGSLEERQAARNRPAGEVHHIGLLPYLNLNTTYIRQELENYVAGFNSTYTPASYSFEGTQPSLQGDTFDENAPCQTLLLDMGTPGKHIDIEKLYNRVLDAYSFNNFQVDATDVAPEELPEPLDLDAIHQQLSTEPVDAVYNKETGVITPETYGYTFDLDRAKELVAEAEYGAVIGIPMEYVEPNLISRYYFRDVLGYAETEHTNNENRNTNLRLACAALDGIILMPGEEISYNQTLGKRTAEAGYKPAPAYNGGKTVNELGGGICQVSSTLYYAALLADMEIVNRQEHSFKPSYIPLGMDATVSWGGPDFVFRNNSEYPIRIDAEVSDGYVRVSIVGTDLRDYYVTMEYEVLYYTNYEVIYEDHPAGNAEGYEDGDVIQTPYTGCKVETYKCRYDKETDELISREFEATSTYKSRDQIIARVPTEEPEPPAETEPEETTPPETEPEETTPPESTPEETPPAQTPSETPSGDTSSETSQDTSSSESTGGESE